MLFFSVPKLIFYCTYWYDDGRQNFYIQILIYYPIPSVAKVIKSKSISLQYSISALCLEVSQSVKPHGNWETLQNAHLFFADLWSLTWLCFRNWRSDLVRTVIVDGQFWKEVAALKRWELTSSESAFKLLLLQKRLH